MEKIRLFEVKRDSRNYKKHESDRCYRGRIRAAEGKRGDRFIMERKKYRKIERWNKQRATEGRETREGGEGWEEEDE